MRHMEGINESGSPGNIPGWGTLGSGCHSSKPVGLGGFRQDNPDCGKKLPAKIWLPEIESREGEGRPEGY